MRYRLKSQRLVFQLMPGLQNNTLGFCFPFQLTGNKSAALCPAGRWFAHGASNSAPRAQPRARACPWAGSTQLLSEAGSAAGSLRELLAPPRQPSTCGQGFYRDKNLFSPEIFRGNEVASLSQFESQTLFACERAMGKSPARCLLHPCSILPASLQHPLCISAASL